MARATVSTQHLLSLGQLPKRTFWTVLVTTFWLTILLGTIGGFFLGWSWTGFERNGKLWDWLALLSGPIFISALPFVFRGPARPEDQQEPAALKTYQDQMLDLVLNKQLLASQSGSEVQEVARARTLIALRQMGSGQKREVLQFLHENGLIWKINTLVDLRDADLRHADLTGAKLIGIQLNGVDLTEANLAKADLRASNLSNANLRGANMTEADLTGANLGGATY
jgi:Pentapeptide repeats (8 copies)